MSRPIAVVVWDFSLKIRLHTHICAHAHKNLLYQPKSSSQKQGFTNKSLVSTKLTWGELGYILYLSKGYMIENVYKTILSKTFRRRRQSNNQFIPFSSPCFLHFWLFFSPQSSDIFCMNDHHFHSSGHPLFLQISLKNELLVQIVPFLVYWNYISFSHFCFFHCIKMLKLVAVKAVCTYDKGQGQ